MRPMLTRAERLWRGCTRTEGKKIFRYTMVSVISTVVSFVVLFLVTGVFQCGPRCRRHLRQQRGPRSLLLAEPETGRGARVVSRT